MLTLALLLAAAPQPDLVRWKAEAGRVTVTRPTERGEDRALHGLTRTLIANMVEGVTNGFEKRLEIQGVGYRAAMSGTNLELQGGYSHPVRITPRQGIECGVCSRRAIDAASPIDFAGMTVASCTT